jgi:O-antigen ligase
METLDAGEGADTSIMARFDLIRVGLAAFLQSPLVGHGWAHLGSVAAAIDPEGPGRLWGSYFSYHNDAVNFAVAGGAIGIACWLALLAAPLLGPRPAILPARSRCAADRSLGYARWMLVLGCAVFGLTDMVLGYDLPTTLHAFIGASLLGWSRQAGR